MARKTYLRPLGLVFGNDARLLIAAGRAGALGGLAHIGFSHVEVIERGTSKRRDIVPYTDGLMLDHITMPRPAFGGLEMSQCRIMGIVNVTPDSFSDGGMLDSAAAAISHGRQLTERKTLGHNLADGTSEEEPVRSIAFIVTAVNSVFVFGATE